MFSPPHTAVRLHGEPVANGFVLEIDDRGLGLTPDALLEANLRLAETPEFELSDTDRLGLFVVSRLAQRHGRARLAAAVAVRRHHRRRARPGEPAHRDRRGHRVHPDRGRPEPRPRSRSRDTEHTFRSGAWTASAGERHKEHAAHLDESAALSGPRP